LGILVNVSSQNLFAGQRNIEQFRLERASGSHLVFLFKEEPTLKLNPALKLDQVADP